MSAAPPPARTTTPGATAARTPLLVVQVGPPELLDRPGAVRRTVQPCRALGELPDLTVVSGSIFSPALWGRPGAPNLLHAADVLVLRDVADPDLLPVIAARRRSGRLTIYEMGDHVLGRPVPDDGFAPDDELVARSLPPQLARQADGLQVPSAALSVQLSALNPRRAVFPSQLWEPPGPPAARVADRMVIGWMGGRAERSDLALAIPALAGVLDRHPEVRVAVMGDPELRALLGPLPAARVSLIPAGSLERAQRFWAEVDIGLGPLGDTAYNRCRDDVRFLELAASGALAVCADLEPYRDVVRPGQTGFLFRDAGELETVLERALAEPELRAAIPARALRAVSERIERRHAAARLGFYLAVAAEVGVKLDVRADSPGAGMLPGLSGDMADGRIFPDARYVALGAGKVERLLAEGWRQRAAGARDEARRLFAEAEALTPDSHLPPLLLAMSTEDDGAALAALARAEARHPQSCHAAYLRGLRLLSRSDEAGAAAAFERARAIAPAFGAPQERLGALAEAAGRLDDAARLYEEAALQNGTFALPLARLAQLARGAGRLDKAVALLERSLSDDPDLGLTNFLVGRAYGELQRFHQARVHLRRALAWLDARPPRENSAPPPLVDGAEDRMVVLTELARAEAELGG